MPTWLAGAVVFFTSGSVLVLEILAGRLLAPYVGVRLETYTSVIGIVLAGISLGTWLGGRLADRVDPRRTLGPLMVVGGGLAMLSPPAVHGAGHPTWARPTPSSGWPPSGSSSRRRPQRGEPGRREAPAAGPRRHRPGRRSPLGRRHRRCHRRHLPGRLRAGGRCRHQRGHHRRGCRPGAGRLRAVDRPGPAPTAGCAGVSGPGGRGGRGHGRSGVGRALRRRDPLPLRPRRPRSRSARRTIPVARHHSGTATST